MHIKAFITGVNGFAARHLSALLRDRGAEIHGIDLQPDAVSPDIAYCQADLLDTDTLARLLAAIKPDRIFHLGAMSLPSGAEETPMRALQVNIMGSVSLLDAARRSAPRARILLVGSSKEYGAARNGRRKLAEKTPLSPRGFYGISKHAMEMIGMEYARKFSLPLFFTRSFNHTGPGQSPEFVCSDWAKQAAEITLGIAGPGAMQVGNTNEEIDFLDVRDVVRAYEAITERGKTGQAYNVCRGTAVSLNYVLKYLCAKIPFKVAIVRSESRLKGHSGLDEGAGSCRLLREHTGWRPVLPIEKTLDDLFMHWKNLLAK
jgi:GDP-4-dehydro-6-deoxy-D-mannose reductase